MFYAVLLSTLAMQFYSSTGVQVGDQTMVNNVAGFMVEQLTEKYHHSIGIGNLTSSYMFGAASFEALNGNVSDIHTIEPHGDVVVVSDNDELNVTLTFTFTTLKVVFPDVSISLMGLSTCGTLEGSAEDNLFSVFARISENSRCFVALQDFDVLRLGDFSINFTPKVPCTMISGVSTITTMAVNYYQNTIKKRVEEGIHKALREQIVPNDELLGGICITFEA